jgi:hypothetical protein
MYRNLVKETRGGKTKWLPTSGADGHALPLFVAFDSTQMAVGRGRPTQPAVAPGLWGRLFRTLTVGEVSRTANSSARLLYDVRGRAVVPGRTCSPGKGVRVVIQGRP